MLELVVEYGTLRTASTRGFFCTLYCRGFHMRRRLGLAFFFENGHRLLAVDNLIIPFQSIQNGTKSSKRLDRLFKISFVETRNFEIFEIKHIFLIFSFKSFYSCVFQSGMNAFKQFYNSFRIC